MQLYNTLELFSQVVDNLSLSLSLSLDHSLDFAFYVFPFIPKIVFCGLLKVKII